MNFMKNPVESFNAMKSELLGRIFDNAESYEPFSFELALRDLTNGRDIEYFLSMALNYFTGAKHRTSKNQGLMPCMILNDQIFMEGTDGKFCQRKVRSRGSLDDVFETAKGMFIKCGGPVLATNKFATALVFGGNYPSMSMDEGESYRAVLMLSRDNPEKFYLVSRFFRSGESSKVELETNDESYVLRHSEFGFRS